MILWHTTTEQSLEAIRDRGFRDAHTNNLRYKALRLHPGVWVSTLPLIDDDTVDGAGTFNFEAHKQKFLKLKPPEGFTLPEAIADHTWTAGEQYLLSAEQINVCEVKEVSLLQALQCRFEHDPNGAQLREFCRAAIINERPYGQEFLELIRPEFSDSELYPTR